MLQAPVNHHVIAGMEFPDLYLEILHLNKRTLDVSN